MNHIWKGEVWNYPAKPGSQTSASDTFSLKSGEQSSSFPEKSGFQKSVGLGHFSWFFKNPGLLGL